MLIVGSGIIAMLTEVLKAKGFGEGPDGIQTFEVRPRYPSLDCPPIGVIPTRPTPAYRIRHNNNTGTAKARRESEKRRRK